MAKLRKIGFKIESQNTKEVPEKVQEVQKERPKCFGDYNSKICTTEYFCGIECALECKQKKEKSDER